MKKFVVFGAGLVLGGAIGYFGCKKFEDMKEAKRVTERRTYPQYNAFRYVAPRYCDEIVFKTREEAEKVLRKLIKIAGEYNSVSIADFYEAAGRSVRTFTDNNWGWMDCAIEWTSIKYSAINPVGWYLDLPNPEPIN